MIFIYFHHHRLQESLLYSACWYMRSIPKVNSVRMSNMMRCRDKMMHYMLQRQKVMHYVHSLATCLDHTGTWCPSYLGMIPGMAWSFVSSPWMNSPPVSYASHSCTPLAPHHCGSMARFPNTFALVWKGESYLGLGVDRGGGVITWINDSCWYQS